MTPSRRRAATSECFGCIRSSGRTSSRARSPSSQRDRSGSRVDPTAADDGAVSRAVRVADQVGGHVAFGFPNASRNVTVGVPVALEAAERPRLTTRGSRSFEGCGRRAARPMWEPEQSAGRREAAAPLPGVRSRPGAAAVAAEIGRGGTCLPCLRLRRPSPPRRPRRLPRRRSAAVRRPRRPRPTRRRARGRAARAR